MRMLLPASMAVLMTIASLLASPALAEKAKLTVNPVSVDVGVDGTSLKDGRLMPESSTVKIRYTFDVVVPAATSCYGTIRLDLKPPASDERMSISLSPASISRYFDGSRDGSTAVDGFVSPTGTTMTGWSTVLTLQFTRNAPAFTPMDVSVKAQAILEGGDGASCNIDNSAESTSRTTVIPDIMLLMEYTPAAYIRHAGPGGEVTFAVEARNLGNGATRISTSLPTPPKGLEAVIPPADAIVESKAQSGQGARDSSVLVVSARTPKHTGYTNKVVTLEISFLARPQGASSGATAEPVTLTLALQIQGASLPGFDASPMLGAVVIAGAVAVRRRSASRRQN